MASSKPVETSGRPPPLTTAGSRSPETLRRSSSIKFSAGTKTSSPSRHSAMTSQKSSSHDGADEQTPINSISASNYQTSSHKSSHPQKISSSPEPDLDNAARSPSRLAPSSTVPNTTRQRAPSPLSRKKSEEDIPWYQRLVTKYGSIELENKGSVARDHLALERTFLAWVRTSLAFASIGIAITQLFRLNTTIANRSSSSSSFATEISVPFSPLLTRDIPDALLPHLAPPSSPPPPSTPGADQHFTINTEGGAPPAPAGAGNLDIDNGAATRLRHVGKPLGATFLAVSILVLFVGFHRYFESQHWIVRGKFPASRGSVALVGLVAGALIVASLVVVLAVAPRSFER